MIQSDKKNFCLVGFGNHAKNKLLPSLEMGGHLISSIVSSKKKLKSKYIIYSCLQDALQNSDTHSHFIISSPPKAHFSQIKEILKAGRNIYVEKPIFVELDEAKNIFKNLKSNEFFVVELLMYKYTKLYENFINIWNKKKNNCTQMECFFNIPSVNGNTFRDSKNIKSSPLYDIGCYILSLLVDLNISLENLKIHNINIQNNKIINLCLKGVFKKMKIYAEFGMGKEYKNQVKLKFQKDFKIVFDKFFFGVEAEKQIIFEKKNRKRIFFVKDVNGFKKIFEYSNSFWLKNQRERFDNIIKVNQKLSILDREVSLNNIE